MPMSPLRKQPRRKAEIVDLHGSRRTRRVAAQPDRAAVRQGHIEHAMPQLRDEAKRQPDNAGQFREYRVYSFRCEPKSTRTWAIHRTAAYPACQGRSTWLHFLRRADNAGEV